MFPFRFSSIFRSRWMALFFAANILWFADDVVSSTDAKHQTAAEQAENAELAALAKDREGRLAEIVRQ